MAALLVLVTYAGVGTDAARRQDPDRARDSPAGQLPLAAPDLEEPNFRETVVYLVHHNQC